MCILVKEFVHAFHSLPSDNKLFCIVVIVYMKKAWRTTA